MRRLRDATHNESLLCMYNLTQFATTGRVPVADLLPTDVEAGLDGERSYDVEGRERGRDDVQLPILTHVLDVVQVQAAVSTCDGRGFWFKSA